MIKLLLFFPFFKYIDFRNKYKRYYPFWVLIFYGLDLELLLLIIRSGRSIDTVTILFFAFVVVSLIILGTLLYKNVLSHNFRRITIILVLFVILSIINIIISSLLSQRYFYSAAFPFLNLILNPTFALLFFLNEVKFNFGKSRDNLICGLCRAVNEKDAKFCVHCGHKLIENN